MRTLHCLLTWLIFATMWSASAVDASSVEVPEDFPTIQEAIDSGADTVLVDDGRFPENLLIQSSVALLNYGDEGLYPAYPVETFPETGRLSIVPSTFTRLVVRGFRFLGPVRLPLVPIPGLSATFEQCRMDSGVVGGGGEYGVSFAMKGCTVRGGVDVTAGSVEILLNAILGGGIRVSCAGIGRIRGNVVQGPAEHGILGTGTGLGEIRGNTVSGATHGIRSGLWSVDVLDNEVMDCAEVGYSAYRDARFYRNTALRCGGVGIRVESNGAYAIAGNIVDRCAGDGIVSQAGEDLARCDSNVVGRSGGHGIVTLADIPVRFNTSFSNQGSGFRLAGGTVSHNIAYGNQGYGMEGTGTVDCNDWFANAAGATSGVSPGVTDLAVDPMFCNVDSADVHLKSTSPLADAPGCGRIGALGVGCSDVPTPALVSGFAAEASGGDVVLRWRVARGQAIAGVSIERAEDPSGPWHELAIEVRDAGEESIAVDPGAAHGTWWYRASIRFAGGEWLRVGPIAFDSALPRELALSLGGSNPSSERVGITLAIPRTMPVRLSVFDVQGREIAVLAQGPREAGIHRLEWDGRQSGRRVAGGVYFLRVTTPEGERSRRVVLAP